MQSSRLVWRPTCGGWKIRLLSRFVITPTRSSPATLACLLLFRRWPFGLNRVLDGFRPSIGAAQAALQGTRALLAEMLCNRTPAFLSDEIRLRCCVPFPITSLKRDEPTARVVPQV